MSRTRHSLREIEYKYNSGEDRSLLENLVRAFRGIQALDPCDEDSFFTIAGYHGEPFRPPKGKRDPGYWGGYCNHGNVLFPLWHRAYLLRLENALRSVPGCQDVTLPFWDECFASTSGGEKPIPTILTTQTFDLDGRKDNPLYSYKLQRSLEDAPAGNGRYTKHEGYETVRYPLAGLVGNEQDRKETETHNQAYPNADTNAGILNKNVADWLDGTVKIPDDDVNTRRPDTYSIFHKFVKCLRAPDYTVFSNITSANQHHKDSQKKAGRSIENHQDKLDYVVPLESPHNAIHLAVGGFYSRGDLNADPIPGANGDMGDNETASFDPIFFFHHAFIDYVFWTWQKSHRSTDKLEIKPGYAGTEAAYGLPDIPVGTTLDLNTPLFPFKKPDGNWYTGDGVTDIVNQLDYHYGPGSLDRYIKDDKTSKIVYEKAPIVNYARSDGINRADYPGSFVVRTYAQGPGQKEPIEIGREAILSRWSVAGCANCQNSLNVRTYTPVDTALLDWLKGQGDTDDANGQIQYSVKIQTHHGIIDAGDQGGPQVALL